jgi:phospholipase A1/A2
MFYKKIYLFLLSISFSMIVFADPVPAPGSTSAPATLNTDITPKATTPPDVVEERTQKENTILNNPFAISFYQPTYIIPFYYTGSPYNAVYQGNLPDNQQLMHDEVKFQFSFKYPLWNFNKMHRLYLAYTQMSYWQAYQRSPFFRETDYQPEIFLANQVYIPLGNGWATNFLNVGAMHQSNGEGDTLERSWNRIYINAIESKGNFMVQIEPWYIIQDNSMETHNSDIGRYLGYGQMVFAYKYSKQVFALQVRNELESGFSRGALQFTWSFPLGTRNLKGYVQVFSGYGQSLIEYNHYTNSAGIGLSLSDWL